MQSQCAVVLTDPPLVQGLDRSERAFGKGDPV